MPKKPSETKKETKKVDFNGVVLTGTVSKIVYDSEKMSMFTIACNTTDKFTSYVTCKMFANDIDDFEDLMPDEGDELGIAGKVMTEKYTDKKTKKEIFSTYIKVKEICFDVDEFKKKWSKSNE